MKFTSNVTVKDKKGYEKIYHANSNQKKAGVDILLWNKTGFRAKRITKKNPEKYMMIKESIQQEVIAVLNEYVLNKRATKYVKQKWIKV